jgi:hypothetical protein
MRLCGAQQEAGLHEEVQSSMSLETGAGSVSVDGGSELLEQF